MNSPPNSPTTETPDPTEPDRTSKKLELRDPLETLGTDPESFRRSSLRLAYIFYGFLLVGSILVGPWLGAAPLHWMPRGPGFWTTGPTSLALGLAAGGLIVGLGHLLTPFLSFLRQMKEGFSEPLFWIRNWNDIFILAATSSIAEEAFFRGCLQPQLGIGWTSVIFAVCHPPLQKKLRAWPLFAWLVSLLLGSLYQLGGNALIAPIACHFTINFCNLGILTSQIRRQNSGSRTDPN
jgi:membrane protease YdiL (CAAX protease family)